MMTIRTQTAFDALMKLAKGDDEVQAAVRALQEAVTAEIEKLGSDVARQTRALTRTGLRGLLSTVAGERILERAMQADPRATELDLIEAGERDAAAKLGAWHTAETYRAHERAESQSVGG